MHKKLHTRIFDWYESRFYLPHELRVSLINKNLTHLSTVLSVVLAYGLAGFLYKFFSCNHNYQSVYYQLWYFGTFVVFSIVGILLTFIVRKIKKAPYFIKTIPYVISLSFAFALIVFTFGIMQNIFKGLVLFASVGIISVLCLYIEPIIFLVLLVVVNLLIDPNILRLFGTESLFDFVILSVLLFFLLIYKQKSAKHDLLRTHMLEENRSVLQDAMAEQIQEIQIQNKELKIQHQRIVDIQNNTIISLSNLVENRDSDTGEHVRRTSAYVNLLANKVKNNGFYEDIVDDCFITTLTKAAPMHDIGKIVVPDSILKKPGRLTEEEFNQIKRHTTEGGRIVREILGDGEDIDYINMAIEVATSHHERWDGKGYPSGLKACNIPLSARIMAIADVFDALVSPRCYKEPFSVSKAMEIIKEESGSHFDPVLANLFIGMEDDAIAIMEKYKD